MIYLITRVALASATIALGLSAGYGTPKGECRNCDLANIVAEGTGPSFAELAATKE